VEDVVEALRKILDNAKELKAAEEELRQKWPEV